MTEKEAKNLEVIDKRPEFPVDEPIQVEQDSPNAIVMMAMQKGYDAEFIEKMMTLAERNQANLAKQAYYQALANFKAEAPPVKKDKRNNQFDSWYTSLGCLLDTYNPYLGKHGLSISFATLNQDEKSMTVECRLTHREGHSEAKQITAPIDQAAIGKQSGQRSRNAIQDIKSTFTYLRSATCEAVLGVAGTEGTVDDDGNSAGIQHIDERQVSSIKDMLDNLPEGVDKEKTEKGLLERLGCESIETIPTLKFQNAMSALKATKDAWEHK